MTDGGGELMEHAGERKGPIRPGRGRNRLGREWKSGWFWVDVGDVDSAE